MVAGAWTAGTVTGMAAPTRAVSRMTRLPQSVIPTCWSFPARRDEPVGLRPLSRQQEQMARPRRSHRAAGSGGPPDGLERHDRRARWAVLASLTLVSFLLLLDDTAVALALPSIREQLGLGLTGMEWVVNGYTLPFAALVLLAGQVADRYGRRRVFLIGLAVFTLASLLAGLAGDTTTLIGARALQGVGAALVAPASLSIIAATFPAKERGWALGVWAGVTATALGIGPLLGALVNDSLGWAPSARASR
jgi:hypothetical protein